MAQAKEWNWGQKLEDFPSGLWDDFDGSVEILEYEKGDYNTQIHGIVCPEQYEFEARELDEPEEGSTDGLAQFFWSLGGDTETFDVSQDGMDITGPAPTKQTRGAKGMVLLVANSGIKMTSKRLDAFNDADNPAGCHWVLVNETTTNPETKERTTRPILYPSGSKVGSANYGKAKPARGRGGRRGRAGASDAEIEEAAAPEEEPKSRRRGRAASTDTTEDAPATSPNGDATPRRRRAAASAEEVPPADEPAESNGDEGQEAAIALLAQAVGSKGEDGLTRRGVNTALMALEEEAGADLVKEAVKRATITAALESGAIIEEDGKLYLPEEEAPE